MQNAKETITVKKAMEYVKRNVNNRPLSRSWVEELSEIITAGEFKLNGDAIRFNSNGDLIDGQHRLHAFCQGYQSRRMLFAALSTPHSIPSIKERKGIRAMF